DFSGAGTDLLPRFRPPDDCPAVAGVGGGGRHLDPGLRAAPPRAACPWAGGRVVDALRRNGGCRRQRRVPARGPVCFRSVAAGAVEKRSALVVEQSFELYVVVLGARWWWAGPSPAAPLASEYGLRV